jgi:hypothetical protein
MSCTHWPFSSYKPRRHLFVADPSRRYGASPNGISLRLRAVSFVTTYRTASADTVLWPLLSFAGGAPATFSATFLIRRNSTFEIEIGLISDDSNAAGPPDEAERTQTLSALETVAKTAFADYVIIDPEIPLLAGDRQALRPPRANALAVAPSAYSGQIGPREVRSRQHCSATPRTRHLFH